MQKPKKLKKYWKKLKYWQKGGIIGFLFGFSSFIPLIGVIGQRFTTYLLVLIIWIFRIEISGPSGELIAYIALFVSPFVYFIIGSLIGLIIGKLKKK